MSQMQFLYSGAHGGTGLSGELWVAVALSVIHHQSSG